ncbi:uncharacterized protein MONBRDRAFT_10226, partial [Monosiga brevicollis MX1]
MGTLALLCIALLQLPVPCQGVVSTLQLSGPLTGTLNIPAFSIVSVDATFSVPAGAALIVNQGTVFFVAPEAAMNLAGSITLAGRINDPIFILPKGTHNDDPTAVRHAYGAHGAGAFSNLATAFDTFTVTSTANINLKHVVIAGASGGVSYQACSNLTGLKIVGVASASITTPTGCNLPLLHAGLYVGHMPTALQVLTAGNNANVLIRTSRFEAMPAGALSIARNPRSDVTIAFSTFVQCARTSGAALLAFLDFSKGNVPIHQRGATTVRACAFTDGGVAVVSEDSEVSVIGATFTNNSVPSGHAVLEAIDEDSTFAFSVQDSTFTRNQGQLVLASQAGDAVVRDCVFQHNSHTSPGDTMIKVTGVVRESRIIGATYGTLISAATVADITLFRVNGSAAIISGITGATNLTCLHCSADAFIDSDALLTLNLTRVALSGEVQVNYFAKAAAAIIGSDIFYIGGAVASITSSLLSVLIDETTEEPCFMIPELAIIGGTCHRIMTMADDSIWNIESNLVIGSQGSLVVSEGAQLLLSAGMGVQVLGSVVMAGTESKPVVLTCRPEDNAAALGTLLGCRDTLAGLPTEDVQFSAATKDDCVDKCAQAGAAKALYLANQCICPSAPKLSFQSATSCAPGAWAVSAAAACHSWGTFTIGANAATTSLSHVTLRRGGFSPSALAGAPGVALQVNGPADLDFVTVSGSVGMGMILNDGPANAADTIQAANVTIEASKSHGLALQAGSCQNFCFFTGARIRQNQGYAVYYNGSTDEQRIYLQNSFITANALSGTLDSQIFVQGVEGSPHPGIALVSTVVTGNTGSSLLHLNHAASALMDATLSSTRVSVTGLFATAGDHVMINSRFSRLRGGISLSNPMVVNLTDVTFSGLTDVAVKVALTSSSSDAIARVLLLDRIRVVESTGPTMISVVDSVESLPPVHTAAQLRNIYLHDNNVSRAAVEILPHEKLSIDLLNARIEDNYANSATTPGDSGPMPVAALLISGAGAVNGTFLDNVILDNPRLSVEVLVVNDWRINATDLYVPDAASNIVCLADNAVAPVAFSAKPDATFDCSSINDCSGHGTCILPQICLCNAGHEGDDCSLTSCAPGTARPSAGVACTAICEATGAWPQAFVGETVTMPCLTGQEGSARRTCLQTGYGTVDRSDCRSPELVNLKARFASNGFNDATILQDWASEVTRYRGRMGAQDVAVCLESIHLACETMGEDDENDIDVSNALLQVARVVDVLVNTDRAMLMEGERVSTDDTSYAATLEEFAFRLRSRLVESTSYSH